MIVDGIPVRHQSPARCWTSPRWSTDARLERAFDQAETLDVFDLNAILDQVERNRSRHGSRRIRRVLEDVLHRQRTHRE